MPAVLIVVAAVAACTGPGAPGPAGSPAPPDPAAITVASFNFDESRLLAEVYAQAIEARGMPVRRELDLGPRELVQPALQQGLVDLVPEYLGSALASFSADQDLDRGERDAVRRALQAAVRPLGVEVAEPAPAQNQNAFTVTRRFAEINQVTSVSDLRALPAPVVVGGPAECPDRPYCLLGLRDVYGVVVDRFVVLDGSARTRRALEEGVIDVGVMFTTDGHLADPALVPLRDDRGLNPVDHVVPLVRSEVLERHGDALRAVLDDVSSRLTTPALRFLGWRVSVAGNHPADEARGWLLRQGLIDRP